MTALAEKACFYPSPQIVWHKTLDAIRQEGKTYALSWLERLSALDVREDVLVLAVQDRFFRDWIDDHYRKLLEDTLARLPSAPPKVAFEVVELPAPSPVVQPTHRSEERRVGKECRL